MEAERLRKGCSPCVCDFVWKMSLQDFMLSSWQISCQGQTCACTEEDDLRAGTSEDIGKCANSQRIFIVFWCRALAKPKYSIKCSEVLRVHPSPPLHNWTMGWPAIAGTSTRRWSSQMFRTIHFTRETPRFWDASFFLSCSLISEILPESVFCNLLWSFEDAFCESSWGIRGATKSAIFASMPFSSLDSVRCEAAVKWKVSNDNGWNMFWNHNHSEDVHALS